MSEKEVENGLVLKSLNAARHVVKVSILVDHSLMNFCNLDSHVLKWFNVMKASSNGVLRWFSDLLDERNGKLKSIPVTMRHVNVSYRICHFLNEGDDSCEILMKMNCAIATFTCDILATVS